jgi:hypothetical protein
MSVSDEEARGCSPREKLSDRQDNTVVLSDETSKGTRKTMSRTCKCEYI